MSETPGMSRGASFFSPCEECYRLTCEGCAVLAQERELYALQRLVKCAGDNLNISIDTPQDLITHVELLRGECEDLKDECDDLKERIADTIGAHP